MAAVLACAAVGLIPLTPGAASAAEDNGCHERQNNSVAKLVQCIKTADLWKHMVNFQKIADANPGPDGHPSRNSGEPGYKASVDYVAKTM